MTLFEFNSFLTTNTNNKTNKHMKKLIAMLGAVVAAVTSAWAGITPTHYTEESGYAKFSYSKIINWRGDGGTFHDQKVTELQADGSEGAQYSLTANNGDQSWQRFAENQNGFTNYSAPVGLVLRLDSTTAYKTIDAQFAPFNMGGLIVEAEGYSFVSDNRDDRGTLFGDTTGQTETYMDIKKSIMFKRGGSDNSNTSPNTFYGTVNLFVDDGAVFNFNADNTKTAHKVFLKASKSGTAGAVSCLKMSGKGTMSLKTLKAEGSTLDYSALAKDHVFITGNIAVDNATILRLPAGVAAGETYQLCSGTVTAENSVVPNKTIYVGTEVIEGATLTYSGNTVSYATVANTSEATINGTSTLSALSWSNALTQGVLATLNVEGDSKLALDESFNLMDLLMIKGSNELVVTTPALWDASKINLDEFSGKIVYEYDATAGLTIDGDAATAIRTSTNTYRFLGSEENGVTLDMGCPNAAIHSHLIFQGGTHSLTHGYTNAGADGNKFGVGATDDNPTVLVTGGATLNFNARDISYWSGAFSNDGVIRVNDGATLNLRDQDGNTMYYRQRFYFEPGATITASNAIKNGAPVFRLIGGINASSEQIFIPENTSGKEKVVTLTGNIRMPTDTTQGFAMNIGANSKLKIVGEITAAGNYDICKRGAGELEVTGGIATARIYGAGKITVPADTSIVAHPTSNTASAHPTILGSGKVILPELAENTPRLTMDDSWTGTVEIPALQQEGTRTYLDFNNWGNANSTIVMKGLTGTSIWMQAGTTINPTVQLDGAVTINNGGSNSTYTFDKITGTGNLTVSSWATCNYGLTYKFNTIKNYSGTLTAQNASNNCAFTLGIGDIVAENEPTYGDKVLSLTRTCTGTNKTLNYDVSATKLNGQATALALTDDGIYVAVAKIGSTGYATVQAAIDALQEGEVVTLIDTEATLPEGWAKATKDGNTILRQVGEIYYIEGYMGASADALVIQTADGAETSFVEGDTLVIGEKATVVQAWMADTFDAKNIKVAKDFTLHSGVDAAILDGATVTVVEGKTLTLNNSGSQKKLTLDSVELNGAISIGDSMSASEITGTATITIADIALTLPSKGENVSIVSGVAGKKVVCNDGVYTLVNDKTPLEIFTETINAAAEGATVQLPEGLVGCLKIENANNITLDLNGNTITADTTATIRHEGSGTLTIKDTVGGGKVVNTANATDMGIAVWARGGSVVIEGGAFESASLYEATVYIGAGTAPGKTITISGGTFKNVAEGKYHWKQTLDPIVLNVWNSMEPTAISVTGGSFSSDPANGDDNKGGTFLAEGYVSTLTDGLYVVTKGATRPSVVDGGSTDQQSAYDTWAAANGVTGSTTASLADAFAIIPDATGLKTEAAVLAAAKEKLDTLITDAMVAELVAKLADGVTTVTIPGYPNATFKFVPVPQSEITTSAKLFRLTAEFVPANGQN